MSYTHLTLEELFCLAELLNKGSSIRAIARILERSPSTISREIKRNKSKKGYNGWRAYSMAVHRRRKPRKSSLQLDPEKQRYVITHIQEGWTPEQIAERWKLEHPDSTLSCSTIYRHIKRGLIPGISRKVHLRRHGKRKVNRSLNEKCRTIHPDRLITEWPDVITNRIRFGDWEGDTVWGAKGKGGLVTLVDRKSGYLCAALLRTREAAETRAALVSALEGLPVHSISFDNGPEFAEFRTIETQLDTMVYFAQPHKPWQRGCNENANGLLRFFFPKGCDFLNVSQEELQFVVSLINNRPRKRLAWLSPSEFLFGVALT